MAKYRADLRPAFDAVADHLELLLGVWRCYRHLCRSGTGPAREFRSALPLLYENLRQSLLRTSLLLLRQLLDPPRTGNFRNASLRGLLEANYGPSWKSSWANRRLRKIEENQQIKEFGDKVVAHIDWDVSTGAASPPASLPLETMEDAFHRLIRVVRLLERRFGYPPRNFQRSGIKAEITEMLERFSRNPV